MTESVLSAASALASALNYAAQGWRVFPVHTPEHGKCSCGADVCSVGKHPRTADGFKSATTDEGKIRGWWRTWPTANIGVATGQVSGFFVLDIDPDKGGEETLAKLIEKHGQLPLTVEALTGSGGRHILFTQPKTKVPNSTQRLGPGLDVRGDGGYIVVAPSLHKSGSRYEWQPERGPGTALLESPAWLLELLRPTVTHTVLSPALAADQTMRRAIAYLATKPPAIAGSGGHDALFNVASDLVRGLRLSEQEAISLILTDYNHRCVPEWSEKEIAHKVRSVIETGTRPFGYILDKERDPARAPVAAVHQQPGSRVPGEDDGEEEGKPGLTDEGVADFFATAADKIQWVFEPYIPKGGFVLIQGAPKSGKTWFAAWLAAECAKAGARVAVVEEEGAREVLRDRLKPFVGGALASLNGRLRVLYRKRIRLDDPRSVDALVELYRGFDVIVLDPFIRLHGRKEKESDEMSIVYAAIQRLAIETGAAVVLIHHTKKGDSWNTSSRTDAGLEDARGSGTGTGEADNVIAIKSLPRKDRVVGQVRFVVENPGSRVGAEFEKRTAVVDLSEAAEAPLSWLASNEHGGPEAEENDPVADMVDRIIKSKKLPTSEIKSISATAIVGLIGGNKKAGLEAVKRCVNHGILEAVEGLRGMVYFKPEGS